MGISKKAMDEIQKRFGKESVIKMDDGYTANVEFIPSGSLYMDYALGGGFPRGRIVELFGPESSGKTTTALSAIAEEQEQGGVAFFCDAEHAFDRKYAKSLGVNVDELYLTQPDSGEQALDLTIAMIETGEITIAVIDSTSALTPQSEIDGEMGDAQMGVQARLLSKGLRKLNAVAHKHNCLVIFISQLRESIGPWGGRKIGVGNALKFYASQRVNVKKSQPTMDGGIAIGHDMNIKVEKNKVASPFREAKVFLRYGVGYDKTNEVVILAEEMGIVERKGSWYSYQGTNLAQGVEKTAALINDNPELHEELEKLVIEGLKQQD